MNGGDKSSREERFLDSLNIFLSALTGRGSLPNDNIKKEATEGEIPRRGFAAEPRNFARSE